MHQVFIILIAIFLTGCPSKGGSNAKGVGSASATESSSALIESLIGPSPIVVGGFAEVEPPPAGFSCLVSESYVRNFVTGTFSCIASSSCQREIWTVTSGPSHYECADQCPNFLIVPAYQGVGINRCILPTNPIVGTAYSSDGLEQICEDLYGVSRIREALNNGFNYC